MMSTVEEIVEAAKRLKPAELLSLRQKLERLEQKVWKEQLERTAVEMKEAGVTDGDIDRMVTRRRRESRR